MMILSVLLSLLFTVGELRAQERPDDADGQQRRHKEYGEKKHHRGKNKKHRKMFFSDIRYLKEELNLSDIQIEKVEQINIAHRDELKKYRLMLRPEKQKLRVLLLKEQVNLNAVEIQLQKIADIKVKIRITRIKHRLAIEKILTPEQREKHRQERKKRRKKRRGYDR